MALRFSSDAAREPQSKSSNCNWKGRNRLPPLILFVGTGLSPAKDLTSKAPEFLRCNVCFLHTGFGENEKTRFATRSFPRSGRGFRGAVARRPRLLLRNGTASFAHLHLPHHH